jgi:hypothetical protein
MTVLNKDGCLCGHCCCEDCNCRAHECKCEICGLNGNHEGEAWPEEIEALEASIEERKRTWH